jgi:hypothetical protein
MAAVAGKELIVPLGYDGSGISRETAPCPGCPANQFNLGRLTDDDLYECAEGHTFTKRESEEVHGNGSW